MLTLITVLCYTVITVKEREELKSDYDRGSFTLIAEIDYEFEDVEDIEKELHRIRNHLLILAIYLKKRRSIKWKYKN